MSQAFLLLLVGSVVLSKMVMVDNSASKMPKETMGRQLTNEIEDGDVVRTIGTQNYCLSSLKDALVQNYDRATESATDIVEILANI